MWQSADWSDLEIVLPVIMVGDRTAVVVTKMGDEAWVNVLQYDTDLTLARHMSTYGG
jgi:hypothetical protein